MANVTREEPVTRDGKPKPVTERPRPSKRDVELQSRRETGALGFLQLGAWGAGMMGRYTPVPILPEDIAAVVIHSPSIAHELANCAAEDERFAYWFDKITILGPYGKLLEALTRCAAQVAANHNKGVREGTVDPAQFGAVHPNVLMQMAGMTEESPNGDAPPNAEAA